MAGPDFLSQLPSIDELLEHPKVRAAVDRWNRSSAAGRLRSAVATVGAEVSRQTENLSRLAPGELVERLVRQLDPPSAATPTAFVNATGELFSGPWKGVALAPAAIGAASASAEGARRSAGHAARTAAGLLVAEQAHAFPSHTSALQVALEALAVGGRCVVSRGDMAELEQGVRLDDLCRRAGVALCEVGAADTATVDDYRAALSASDQTPVVVLRRVLRPGVEIADLVSVCRGDHARLLVDVEQARPRQDTPSYASAAPSAESALAMGADAVLLDGAGLVGGPVSGIVAGRHSIIEAIGQSSAAKAAAIEPVVEAALAATLELFQQPAQLRFVHPLYQLLDAPVENLQTRAERIAARLDAADSIESAAAVEVECRSLLATESRSWGVRFRLKGEAPDATRERIANHEPAVFARSVGDFVLFDLRAVAPRDDGHLVNATLPAGEAPAAD